MLVVNEAEQGRRLEFWHGWSYARTHREEFATRKEEITCAIEEQLRSFRVFVAHVPENRERARFEAAIMNNIYESKEPWAVLADRGMALSKRRIDEKRIQIKNISNIKLYGLSETLEI